MLDCGRMIQRSSNLFLLEMKMSCIRSALIGAAALLAVPFAMSAQADDKSARDAILILDASGSMWGQIGGETKMSMAKKAIDGIIDRWPDAGGLGLMAYGHRTKGDCNDIELLAPLGALDKASLKGMVNGLQARGKTPLSASLMQAAEKLKGNEDGATVILVSDGIESCNADPCAIAAQLKKDDVKLVAHVIGFDIADPAAKQQLACIATNTGGVYLDAKDASGLESALNKASQAAQGAKVKTEAPKKPKKDPLAEFNVQGVMRLSGDSDPLTGEGMSWSFYELGSDEDGKGSLIPENGVHYSAKLATKIPVGDYVLVVEYGQARKVMKVSVPAAEPLKLDVSLDAGFVTSEGTVEGSADKAEQVTWEVRQPKNATGEDGKWVATEYKPVPRFVLPAGDYVMVLTKGNAKSEKAFKLDAGDNINVAMGLDVGKLMVSGIYSTGGPKAEKNTAFEVFQPSSSIEGGETKWVATAYDPVSKFDLPSGKYQLKLTVGIASKTVETEIKSGALTKVEIVLDAGVLGWKGAPSENLEIREGKAGLEGEKKWLHTSYDDEGNLAMNVGEYVAIADLGDGVKKEYPFTIKPGERTEITIAQ